VRVAHIIASGVTFVKEKKLTEGPAGELGYGAGGGVSSLWRPQRCRALWCLLLSER
jgi:hypothetical protein